MSSKIEYLKDKFANDRYNSKLANLAYQCAFNFQMNIPSWDQLDIYGFAVVKRCNRLVLRDTLCQDFDPEYDDYQILMLNKRNTGDVFGLVLPPYDESDVISSYLFSDGNYVFGNTADSKLIDHGWLLTNSTGVRLLAVVYELSEKKKNIAFAELMDEMFVDFSKACCKMRKADKWPSFDQAVTQFNKK